MKFVYAVAGLVFCLGPVRGQPPTTLANTVLHFQISTPMSDHRMQYRWYVIDGNGRFQGLWSDSDRPSSPSGIYIVRQLQSGTAGYHVTSANTAALGLGAATLGPLNLVFSSPTHADFIASADFLGWIEIRPAQPAIGPANLSTRFTLTVGRNAIAGFVLPAGGTRFVLLRAVGAGLADFGVASPARGMHLSVASAGKPIARLNRVAWSADSNTLSAFATLFGLTGAFPLDPDAGEACAIVELPPGAHTAIVSADTAGDALVEAYFLP